MHIVVTGREGQIARALVEEATQNPDLTVTALGRPAIDLCQPEIVLRKALAEAEPDVIVNAAAFTKVDLAEHDEDTCLAVNRDGARKVARIAAYLGVPLIQISTDYVFDGCLDRPYVESDRTNPINVYGRSKLQGEEEVARATDNHAILRTSWVFAAEGQNFVRTMLRLAQGSARLRVVADQIGSPTYAPDIARGIIGVARNLVAHPENEAMRGTFHMTAEDCTSWAGFATAIFTDLASRGGPHVEVEPIPSHDYPTPARRPANSRLACSKIGSVHGITLPSWTSGLTRCIDALHASRQSPQTKGTEGSTT